MEIKEYYKEEDLEFKILERESHIAYKWRRTIVITGMALFKGNKRRTRVYIAISRAIVNDYPEDQLEKQLKKEIANGKTWLVRKLNWAIDKRECEYPKTIKYLDPDIENPIIIDKGYWKTEKGKTKLKRLFVPKSKK